MLDAAVIEQLKSVFSKLENEVSLVYAPSFHADQQELTDMLESVASTHPQIKARMGAPADGKQAPVPQFTIYYKNNPTGIFFRGIPGGHEFSSLVLAILNADGKGKLPDPALIQRIKRIKGPVKLKTYISLSCENCPDVVQALNQMALLHGYFEHEMIDGSYAPDEIEALNIQGVPSVVSEGKLLSSGRISLLDLISKLEDHYGKSAGDSLKPEEMNLGHFDVAVIGGGPAGASAAIYSVRKGLKTALISEKFGGQVQETRGIENLISVPYTEGPELAANIVKHVQSYPIQTLENRRVKEVIKGSPHKLIFESGEQLTTQALIVATGAKWRELNIPGEKEYLGRGVAFCPHCDGPFYKGKDIAVIGGGNSGVEAAIDLAGIVNHVTLFEYNESLKADKILVDKLTALKNVTVITSARTLKILGNEQKVSGLEYMDRKTDTVKNVDLAGVFIQIGLVPQTSFLKGVVDLSKFGEIIVDQKGHTSEPGIYAAGDATTTPYKQIIIAMGEGAKAALAAFEDRMLA